VKNEEAEETETNEKSRKRRTRGKKKATGTSWVKHWYELRVKMPVTFGTEEREIVRKQDEQLATRAQQELSKQKRLEEASMGLEGEAAAKKGPWVGDKKGKKITFAGLMEENAVDADHDHSPSPAKKAQLDPSTKIMAKLLDEIHFTGEKVVNYDHERTFDALTDEVQTTIETTMSAHKVRKLPPTTPMPPVNFDLDSISSRKTQAPPGIMPIWALKKRHRMGVPLY
jgi:hypothetical protein